MTLQPSALPLDLDGLILGFGGAPVLRQLTLYLPQGSTTFLWGSNGSGKTSLLNVISGLACPSAGRLSVGKTDLSRLSPPARAARFVARSFQHPMLGDDLTTLQHVSLALYPTRTPWALLRAPSAAPSAAMDALAAMGLMQAAHDTAARLSHAQRKLLDVTLACVPPRPVLLLDEPAAGLDHHEKRRLAGFLLSRREAPTTLIVEHDPEFMAMLGLPVHVLHAGKILCTGTLEAARQAMAEHDVHV